MLVSDDLVDEFFKDFRIGFSVEVGRLHPTDAGRIAFMQAHFGACKMRAKLHEVRLTSRGCVAYIIRRKKKVLAASSCAA